MNPIIAASIAAQRQQDLLATAEHYRRIRRGSRNNNRARVNSFRAERVTPRHNLHTWLLAGRM